MVNLGKIQEFKKQNKCHKSNEEIIPDKTEISQEAQVLLKRNNKV